MEESRTKVNESVVSGAFPDDPGRRSPHKFGLVMAADI
jgi:hypothetical protein